METTDKGVRFYITYTNSTPFLDLILKSLPELGETISKTEVERKTGLFFGKKYTERKISFELHTEIAIRNVTTLLGVGFEPTKRQYILSLE